MLNKIVEMLNEKGYHYNVMNNTVEIRYCGDVTMVFVVVNNQCKIYKYINDSIVNESKWYKRLPYAWKYLIHNA